MRIYRLKGKIYIGITISLIRQPSYQWSNLKWDIDIRYFNLGEENSSKSDLKQNNGNDGILLTPKSSIQ